MIRKLGFVVTAAMFLCVMAFSASAEETAARSWTLAPEISYIKYKESQMKETGMMLGLSGAYTYRGSLTEKLDKMMLRVDGHLGGGQVNYDGQLNDGTPYKIKNINDFLAEIRTVAGYDFGVFSSSTITPYFGIGYRYLMDDLAKDSAGYLRESNYFYSPLGFETKTPLAKGWSIGFTAEYDIFWFGQQKSHLSDVAASLSDVTNDQREGYGVRGSVKLTKASDKVDFFIEPFVRYWNIAESDESAVSYGGEIIGTAVEPKNHSTEFGLRLGAAF